MRVAVGLRISRSQWIALLLLTIAGMVSTAGGTSEANLNEMYVTRLGFVLMLLYCCISGFSGVYTEMVMKNKPQTSIFYQGLQANKQGA